VNIVEAVEVLKRGGVVIHPTDTCYGMTCDYFDPDARARLCRLKHMDYELGSVDEISRYVHVNDLAQKIIDAYFPGKVTIILPDKVNEGTIGVRVPDYPLCHELCTTFGKPLTTTSANISGELAPYSIEETPPGADGVFDAGPLVKNKPSTIVKVEGDDFEILRQGDVRIDIS
jgi:L-threonylcarbamoyladenylate synthase